MIIEIQNKETFENMQMEAVLFQEIKHILKEANYFRNRTKGSLFLDFTNHGQYKGSGYTVKD